MTRLENTRCFAGSQTNANRISVAEPFGSGEDVGHYAAVLSRKIAAGATVAGLHFVEH